MRAIGHFCIFVGFFLAFALLLAALLLGAEALRKPQILLLILPALPGFYGLYVRGFRAVSGQAAGQRRTFD